MYKQFMVQEKLLTICGKEQLRGSF